MRHPSHVRSFCALAALALVMAVATPALAGPPLVCFPFDIGTARSLPWDSTGHTWKGMRADYDVSRLTGDTLALLGPETPVIVRMETLRRATLYATKDPGVAKALLTTLLDRAKSKGSDALAVFDAGYLAETYKQAAPIAAAMGTIATGIDGYALVGKSLAARGQDPAIEFAAAMMTLDGRRGAWADHVRLAKAGTRSDALLARNIGQLER